MYVSCFLYVHVIKSKVIVVLNYWDVNTHHMNTHET